jgi:HK97 gp10 family phage protein
MPITIHGMPQLKSALARKAAQAKAAEVPATQAGAKIVEAIAKARAPKRTGRLAASIRTVRDGDGAAVVAEVPYSAFQEYGTRHHAPQAFMRPAAKAGAPAVATAMTAVFKRAIGGR